VAQQLRVLQSLWAMERRLADTLEWPLQTQLAMIRDSGFDGAGLRFVDPAFVTEATDFLRAHGMIWQAQCYPKGVDWRDPASRSAIPEQRVDRQWPAAPPWCARRSTRSFSASAA